MAAEHLGWTSSSPTLQREVPVVLITGDTSSAIKDAAHQERLRLASKPIQAEELIRLVNDLLGERPMLPQSTRPSLHRSS